MSQSFGEWLDEVFPEGGSGPGLVYTQEDMEAAFQGGWDAAAEHYATGGSFK